MRGLSSKATMFALISLFVVLDLFNARPALAATWEDSVVRIFVTKREVDQTSPWTFEEVRQQTYHGLAVKGPAILTSAFAVQDAVEMDMLRFGESRKFPLQVKFVDFESNLALLVPEDSDGMKGLEPVDFVDEIRLGAPVTIMKARDNNQLVSVAANLQEVGIYSSVTSDYSFATYLIKTQQSALGWSEPVVQDGKIVAMGSGQDTQFLHAIPGAIMRHFLEDHLDDSYRGFPSIGIELDPLTSPEMRAMLHAEKIKNGIRIADVKPGTPFSDLLKENDVLTAIDGKSINENGYFLHALWGKVHLKYLLNRKYSGDAISLSLLRDGNPITIEGKLSRFDSNDSRILSYRPGNREPHIIFGGLVIRELTVPFLRQWGKNWRDVAPYGLLYQLYFKNDVVKDPDQHRFIIISRVLADDFNRGYSDIRNALVKSVNGVAVASLEDVRRALSAPLARGGEQYARFVLGEGDGEIVLSYSGLDEAHKRMANTYHVPSADSFFTR